MTWDDLLAIVAIALGVPVALYTLAILFTRMGL